MINNNNRRVSTRGIIQSRNDPLPVAEQVFLILRDNGFAIDEAIELSAQASHGYRTTTQRLFQFADVVTIQISAGHAELKYAPKNHETPRRTLERIEARENIELNKRARAIRERRERDEGRRW